MTGTGQELGGAPPHAGVAVRFLPENRTWRGDEPTDLFMAAATCDIMVEQPCGSRTVCGKCRVRVVEGDLPPGAADRRLIARADLEAGWRLGCQLVLDAAATVEIPAVSRAVASKSFGEDTMFSGGFAPAVRSVRLSLPEPDEYRQHAALTILAEAVGTNEAALAPSAAAMRELGATLARTRDIRVVLDEGRLTHVTADSDAPAYGIAADIGSTTLAAALVDLEDGTVAASASQINPQVRWGGDIISRIDWAQTNPDRAGDLHGTLITALDALVRQCLEAAGAAPDRICAFTAVGNPTMLHTLLGADITPLGQTPYVGMWQGAWRGPAVDLGLDFPTWTSALLLPGVRSHVGADTVAAVLATGLADADRPRLLIDLGTNSEVVLGCRDFLVCTSTSAGPAFEGATIHHGMRAAPGAIDQVRIRPGGSVMVRTIAGEDPVGICGSGLIDAAAELVRTGIVEPSGRMRTATELDGVVPPTLIARLVDADGIGRAVRLAGSDHRPVLLTARDIRQLQLVKGSIFAGVRMLLDHAGIGETDLDEVLIAGAFGNYIRKTSAQAIGLVPGIDPERVRFVGNAAGAGARLALVSADARARAESLAAAADYIELALRTDYHDAFVDAMPFPAPGPQPGAPA
ncbi:MAG TPA: ASKHA domain-containing protein [Longimicrobiales bacterium]|nr:ASKHA domain-containing protein [Longimicrobiales bacterium]